MKIAIITGASSGMGREFARQITAAEQFDEIWVIARRAERLEALKNELPCPVRPLALDLTQKESFATYQALLKQEQPEVSVLINASGFGKFGVTIKFPFRILWI